MSNLPLRYGTQLKVMVSRNPRFHYDRYCCVVDSWRILLDSTNVYKLFKSQFLPVSYEGLALSLKLSDSLRDSTISEVYNINFCPVGSVMYQSTTWPDILARVDQKPYSLPDIS